MVVLNPNNWHWVDKNTLPWTQTYMQELNISCDAKDGATTVRVTRVNSVSGDSHVSQRKGKVICYFDLDLSFVTEVVEAESGNSVCEGKIVVPELVHDETDFEIRPEGFGDHHALVRDEFVPLLREALCKYQQDLIDHHSRDVQQS